MEPSSPSCSDPRALFESWVALAAGRRGVEAAAHPRGVALRPATGDPVVVAAEPRDDRERHARYLHAHQPAARALHAAEPPVFRCRFASSDGEPVRVLRCALGLFDQAGAPRLRRLTAWHVDPWDAVCVAPGGDRLFAGPLEPWDGVDPVADLPLPRRLEKILAAVERHHRAHREDPALRKTLAARAARRRDEIRQLEAVYRGGRKHVLLRGVETLPDGRLNDADTEHRRRLLDVLARHRTGAAVRVLALGEIACGARRGRADGRRTIALPFAELSG